MKKGFTLTELLVVVLIIGILSSVALPQYMKSVEKARATEAIELLGTLVRAETAYFLSNDTYTKNLSELGIVLPGIDSTDQSVANTNNFQFEVLTANSNVVVAYANRTSVSDPYNIWMIMDNEGKFDMCCKADAPDGTETECDTATATNETCKSIANEIDGTIKKGL